MSEDLRSLFTGRAWAGLGVIAAFYALLVWTAASPALFGLYHDDTLYFSAAKAIASGQGNVLTTLPGTALPSKYPALYPWLLSSAWRLNDSYPENLSIAAAINLALGLAAVAGAFALLRQLGAKEKLALALTAFFAFHPLTVLLSGLLLSDVAFTAFAIWAVVLAAQPSKAEKLGPAALSAALVVAAMATRSIALAVLAGLAAYALLRRRFIFGAALGAIGAVWALAQVWNRGAESSGISSAYTQTLMFYSSYASFWRLCVPDWPTLQAQVVFNLTEMLKEPAVVVFGLPARGFPSPLLAALTIAISVGVLRGVYTRLRQSGVHPIHLCLAAYVPIVLVWNYTLMDRFLFLFLPVFALGAWTEIAGLSAGLRQVFLEPKPWLDRAVSAGLAAALAALLLQAAWRYAVDIPRANRRMTDRRERLLESKREAWRWIREHAPAQAPLIAYEDVTAALATGRPAIRPMAFSTAAFYLQSEPLLQRELEQIGDVAQAAQAQFWLRSDDDFALETGQEKITLAVDGWLQEFPVVFQDELGFIRIHQLFHRSKD